MEFYETKDLRTVSTSVVSKYSLHCSAVHCYLISWALSCHIIVLGLGCLFFGKVQVQPVSNQTICSFQSDVQKVHIIFSIFLGRLLDQGGLVQSFGNFDIMHSKILFVCLLSPKLFQNSSCSSFFSYYIFQNGKVLGSGQRIVVRNYF